MIFIFLFLHWISAISATQVTSNELISILNQITPQDMDVIDPTLNTLNSLKKLILNWEGDVDSKGNPYIFNCPITQEIMENPVMTPTGHFFEEAAIKESLKSKPIDPISQEPLFALDLQKSGYFKALIQWYQDGMPFLTDELIVKYQSLFKDYVKEKIQFTNEEILHLKLSYFFYKANAKGDVDPLKAFLEKSSAVI